jgi:proteic killer suppression protein
LLGNLSLSDFAGENSTTLDQYARKAATKHGRRRGDVELKIVDFRKLDMLDAAQDIRALSTLPRKRSERLRGDRKGQYSIRVNDQWRVCFEWRDGHAYEVEIVDYH